MKQKDREEVADIVMQSMIKAGIVKVPKPKPMPQIVMHPQREPQYEHQYYEPKPTGTKRFTKFFGKKKPPSWSQIKFNEFMGIKCEKGCYLCDSCENKIREIIKNAIEKDE